MPFSLSRAFMLLSCPIHYSSCQCTNTSGNRPSHNIYHLASSYRIWYNPTWENAHRPNGQERLPKCNPQRSATSVSRIILVSGSVSASAACYFAEKLDPLLNAACFGNRWSLRCGIRQLGLFTSWFAPYVTLECTARFFLWFVP